MDEDAAIDTTPLLTNGLTARESGLRGAAAQAALRKHREASAPGDVIRHLRVPVNVAATVRKLATAAQQGSTHASRELRAWMDVLETDIPVSTSELDARTRQRLLDRLLRELEAEDTEGQEADERTP